MLYYAHVAAALSVFALTSAAPHSTTADATFPAFLQFCESAGCTSCQSFDLSTAPMNTCVALSSPAPTTLSYNISQPSGEGLPFTVWVGPAGCSVFTSVRAVNECFNIEPGARPFADYFLIPK
ncbi:hypothetical protein L227DRAFT_576855 [Lentinus tigrinus ALCF2SS1-6]|uniref:Uncharacterized protein n=2 Tax=Lentinus tigrinus TaxID=5365 RepID=A0A5C2S516_9APHY|nr:hypothetical protein L227DRAFT_576855 [Lentinus tigrinus ALCF2SS1-6]